MRFGHHRAPVCNAATQRAFVGTEPARASTHRASHPAVAWSLLDLGHGIRAHGAARSERMASRAMWRGAITFSVVSVPVSMYAASRPSPVDLDLLSPRRRPAARRPRRRQA